LTLDSKQWRWL